MVRVKICCIRNQQEADAAQRAGADAIGLISRMPEGDRFLTDDPIRRLAAANPDTDCFLLTCRTDPVEIRRQVLDAGTDTVQLVEPMTIAALERLRTELPGVSLVQVIHVEGRSAIERALEVEPCVDRILLDSGTPGGPVRTLGGTGNVHDWTISREIVRAVGSPVFLAGGLGPDNVADAIAEVKPDGVDVCSRLRLDGRLDEELLARFFQAARARDR